MLKENLQDSINYVVNGMIVHPLTYVNTAAIAVSMSDIESIFKIGTYCVSIIASLVVVRKHLLEIKKLRNKESDNSSKTDLDE